MDILPRPAALGRYVPRRPRFPCT